MPILRLVLVLAVPLVAGCSREPEPPPQDPRRPAIVVASFDFPESEILAELYGQALRGRGYPVELVARLGTREVVEPALEQGKVDVVPEYLGTTLTFLAGDRAASADANLNGLRDRHGLEFARFEAMPSRRVTAAALETGEIDVGMIETTDASLFKRDLVQLEDDRRLQPAENVVPVVRRQVVDAYGQALDRVLDAVSVQLTTAELSGLNRQVVVDDQPPSAVAAGWLRAHPVT